MVHEGVDGWLFLQIGSNFVTSLYGREGGNLPDKALLAWRDVALERARRCAALGIECLFVVVPDKLTIYGHKTAQPLVDPALAPAIRLHEQLVAAGAGGMALDLVAPMRAVRDECDLYWRTDTHWAPAGCFLAYREICARLGLQPVPDLLSRPHKEYGAVMDLGARVEPMRWETIRSYDFLQNARRTGVNRVTRYLEDPVYRELIHVGARATFENRAAPNDRRVMLIGDSYAEPSGKHLTAMVAETVRSLEFVWSSAVDWLEVRWRRPDVVVIEIAERFLAVPPDDRLRWKWLELRQAWRARALRRAGRPRIR